MTLPLILELLPSKELPRLMPSPLFMLPRLLPMPQFLSLPPRFTASPDGRVVPECTPEPGRPPFGRWSLPRCPLKSM